MPQEPKNGPVSKLEKLESATRVVRQMVSGKASIAAVAGALRGLGASELSIVSTATRVPETRLQELASLGQADLPL